MEKKRERTGESNIFFCAIAYGDLGVQNRVRTLYIHIGEPLRDFIQYENLLGEAVWGRVEELVRTSKGETSNRIRNPYLLRKRR